MKTTFRLSVLVLLLVLAVLAGALRGDGPAAAATKRQLWVVDWPYLDDPKMYEDFTNNNHDVEVHFRILKKDSAIFNHIKFGARPGKYDLVHPYTSWLQRYVDDGLVEEIDTNQLPNWRKVPESIRAIGRCGNSPHELRCPPGALNGTQYFIPWDIGLSSILYRTDKVEEKKGKGAKIDSWGALFDKDYEKHIAMFKDGPSAVAVSTYLNPKKYHETNITPDQLEEIKEEWIEQKPKTVKYWEDELDLINDMTAGNDPPVWVAYAWPSAYDAVKAALKEKGVKGVDVAYADPKERRASWVGVYGILKDTKNKDLAMRFLNEKLADKTSEYLVENFHYAVANQEVMRKVSDPTVKELFPVDVATVLFEQTNFTPELTDQQHHDWPEMWRKVMAH